MRAYLAIVMSLIMLLPAVGNSQQDEIQEHIPCFVYHRFGDDRYPSTNISISDFRKHLEFLKENEYQVVTIYEAIKQLQEGGKPGKKMVVLTVDDGYSSFLENAMPLLEEFGYPATLFINTDHVGYSDFIDWDGIKRLVDQGIEIGNHSDGHPYFVDRRGKELEQTFIQDLETSEKLFRENLGFIPRIYSYPYGEYTPHMQEILEERGYMGAVAQHSGVLSRFTDIYAIPRFPVAGNYSSIEEFKEKIRMRSLPVEILSGGDPVVRNDRLPEIILLLVGSEKILTDRLQCFRSDGSSCEIEYNADKNLIGIRSEKKLTNRRTKINITAPGDDGAWYWFSLLFVYTEGIE